MSGLLTWCTKNLAVTAAASAGLAAVHSVVYRGVRRSLLFGALALGLPALGEYVGVNWMRTLRHHTRPQVKGVPLGAVLSWYAISYVTFAAEEGIWSERGLTPRWRRVVVPAGTALVATSLDLLLDCFGLDLGMWEWRDGGWYACELHGPNGKRGIPLSNFGGWLGLTGGVTLIYLLLTPDGDGPAAQNSAATRQAAFLLLPYYLPAAFWALWRRKPRYLLYSSLVPFMLWRALAGGRQSEPAGQ